MLQREAANKKSILSTQERNELEQEDLGPALRALKNAVRGGIEKQRILSPAQREELRMAIRKQLQG